MALPGVSKRILLSIVNQTADTQTASEPKITLKRDYVDLLSAKVQMLFACFAVLAICLYSWSPSLHVGFLLDDFLHLDYVSRAAAHGDWKDFLANFYSNWAGSDLMKSYRPLVSLSLFTDYLCWGAHAWGYHLTNLLLLWACSVFTGLIAVELSGLKGNRLGASAAIWAALLFSVYPLHLEATAWIIGRVDLLCTVFYLVSVFCYLRFRAIRERCYFHISLVSFILAFLCKEMAVTLPAVIALAEFFLHPLWRVRVAPEFESRVNTSRYTAVLSFWFIMGLLFTWRFIALQVLIGGYGNSGETAVKNFLLELKQSAATFPQAGTLARICFPVNLDLLSRAGQQAWDLKEALQKVLELSYVVIVAGGLCRLIMKSMSLRIVAFLAAWIVVGILPTFQIWGIFPNLVGGRLFFLSSAPFVILLAFLALPAIDAITPRLAKILSGTGAISLLVVLGVWSFYLQFDMQAWLGAAESLESFKKQALAAIQKAGARKQILITNLPTDYSGAGMVTRGKYLRFIMSQPVMEKDYSEQVRSLDPTDPSSSAAAGPPAAVSKETRTDVSTILAQALRDPSVAGIYTWKEPHGLDESGTLAKWQFPNVLADKHWQFMFGKDVCKTLLTKDAIVPSSGNLELEKLEALPANMQNSWTVEQVPGRSFQFSGSSLRIKPGSKDLLLVFPTLNISPLANSTLEIVGRKLSGSVPQFSFMWAGQITSTSNNGKSRSAAQNDFPHGAWKFSSLPFDLSMHTQVALGNNREWALTPELSSLALHLPRGDYEIELSSIELH